MSEEISSAPDIVEDQPPASNPQPQALPEAEPHAPPRPLVAGAFLGGEYEIKELLARGLVNFYGASGGDYSNPTPFFVAEREAPHGEYSAPVESAAPAENSAAQTENKTEAAPEIAAEAMEETEAAIVATLGESEKFSADEFPILDEQLPRESLQSPLFATAKNFLQDGREYLICAWQETISLQDFREPTNDARYLKTMSTLVEGARELEQKNLTADFSRDTLRFDENGNLKYFGFVDAVSNIEPTTSNLKELQEINSFLLKHVFAESATMRLDDEWSGLALSDETKAFATRLQSGEYSSVEELASSLPSSQFSGLRVESALRGDVGQEREINEDSGMILKLVRVGHVQNCDVELYAVADGMGGHEGGEVASDLTLNALQNAILARADEGLNWRDNVAVRAALWQVIEEVNAAVLALTEEPKYRALRNKPGATLVFALRVDAALFIGNVGDSRGYFWSTQAGLTRATKDHSYVQSLIDSGQLKEEDAWDHPDGSIITSHIGMQKLKLRDVFLRLAKPGAKLLLVSDGVVDMLRDEEIAPYLNEENPARVCENLVNAANAAGGHDNITALCVCFS